MRFSSLLPLGEVLVHVKGAPLDVVLVGLDALLHGGGGSGRLQLPAHEVRVVVALPQLALLARVHLVVVRHVPDKGKGGEGLPVSHFLK